MVFLPHLGNNTSASSEWDLQGETKSRKHFFPVAVTQPAGLLQACSLFHCSKRKSCSSVGSEMLTVRGMCHLIESKACFCVLMLLRARLLSLSLLYENIRQSQSSMSFSLFPTESSLSAELTLPLLIPPKSLDKMTYALSNSTIWYCLTFSCRSGLSLKWTSCTFFC